tara:strand:+ start:1385 stop:2377 length:993 start_codon:yes stop_codon:yes gene_type:complete
MAFLDNSGDILLDAVLTDEGRKRLSRADGSFKVVKFSLGDSEINYGLYDKDHASGSAYFDLEILKLPIEIAHTNAAISQRTKLFTLATPNGDPSILYLPELKADTKTIPQLEFAANRNAYALVANDETYDSITNDSKEALPAGFIDARTPDGAVNSLRLRIPLGIDNAAAGDALDVALDPLLDETQYSIVVDDRLMKLVLPGDVVQTGGALQVSFNVAGSSIATPAARSNVFSGDDNLRVYDVATSTEPTLFQPKSNVEVFSGPSTQNVLAPSFVVNQTNQNYLFTTYKTGDVANYHSTTTMEVIQTSIRVIGATTGVSVTVPLEIIRKA